MATPNLNDDPAIINIRFKKGATFRHVLTWETGDSVKNTLPVDLTSTTAALVAKDSETASNLLTMTSENGGITMGGANGEISLFLSAAQTAALNFKRAIYDLEVYFSNGDVVAFMSGNVLVIDELVL